MSISQINIINSLSDAVSWLEREINWGVNSQEWRHLTGRIGELYVAMITRGQFAPQNNQPGYDVVSAEGENISVKTITSSNHVKLNANTISSVDRVIIVEITNDDQRGLEIVILYDKLVDNFLKEASAQGNSFVLHQSAFRLKKPQKSIDELPVRAEATFKSYKIIQYSTAQIRVIKDGRDLIPVKPHLRAIAREIGVSLLNGAGNPKNTQQLGSDIIQDLLVK